MKQRLYSDRQRHCLRLPSPHILRHAHCLRTASVSTSYIYVSFPTFIRHQSTAFTPFQNSPTKLNPTQHTYKMCQFCVTEYSHCLHASPVRTTLCAKEKAEHGTCTDNSNKVVRTIHDLCEGCKDENKKEKEKPEKAAKEKK